MMNGDKDRLTYFVFQAPTSSGSFSADVPEVTVCRYNVCMHLQLHVLPCLMTDFPFIFSIFLVSLSLLECCNTAYVPYHMHYFKDDK